MKHAKYSPSSSSRWIKCPASLQYKPSEEETEASKEGTTAHMLNELCWTKGIDPLDCIGLHLNGFIVDEEMAQGTALWLQTVGDYVKRFPGCTAESEVRLGDGEFFGTADMLLQFPHDVVILDYKYGHTPVEAVNNTQLLCYAAIHLLRRDDHPTYHLVIVQPRNGGVKTWTATAAEVEEFYEKVEATIFGDQTKFCSGSHCNFCPGMLQCPELHQLAVEPRPEEMTPEKAAAVLERAKILKKYLDKVEEYAQNVFESGGAIPGFKLVDTRGQRKWAATEEEILKAARRAGVKKSQMYKSVLLSPAQAEALIGDAVTKLCKVESTGTTVVPLSDRRPGLDIESVRKEFGNE
jgi:hypothetical protein